MIMFKDVGKSEKSRYSRRGSDGSIQPFKDFEDNSDFIIKGKHCELRMDYKNRIARGSVNEQGV